MLINQLSSTNKGVIAPLPILKGSSLLREKFIKILSKTKADLHVLIFVIAVMATCHGCAEPGKPTENQGLPDPLEEPSITLPIILENEDLIMDYEYDVWGNQVIITKYIGNLRVKSSNLFLCTQIRDIGTSEQNIYP